MITIPATDSFTRRIGVFDGTGPGPCVVCAAGLHGNEPAGIVAMQRVLDKLRRRRPPFRGRLVGLCGNLTALRAGRRFIDLDFNRIWTRHRIDAIRAGRPLEPSAAETHEQAQFIEALDDTLRNATGEVFFLDMHTSSAPGTPFVCIGDTLRNRAFALHFPVPVILGLEEHLDGTLLEYINNLGHVTLGFEAGLHSEPATVEYHEAAMWIALTAAGNINRHDWAEWDRHYDYLRNETQNVPRILQVRYRHGLQVGDDFRMEPDFANFQPVVAEQLIARDRRGEIRAPESGRILLPLYQKQGDDGFFLAREVREFWLRLSAAVRRLHLDRVLYWLPGVRRHPAMENTLLVDPRVAHYLAVEFFHLFGYRKLRPENGQWVVSRRRHDSPVPHHAEVGPMT